VLAEGRAIGVLGLASREARAFDDDERLFLTSLARQAGAALERAGLYQRAEAARAEAEAANRMKSDFLATMSHELRTPLTAVLGYTSLLSTGITGAVTDAQRTQLGRIDASARHLLALIDDLLSFAKLKAGHESIAEGAADVAALTREMADLVLPIAETKGLTLRLDVPGEALPHQTDAKKLRQILLNLLGNAVRYTERGTVEISLRHSGGRLRWDVRDSGIGIAPEHQARIFEPFYQVDQSLTRRVEGTGLGLSVTRQLAELLGGEVAVESVVGVGSTFTVWLPARRAVDGRPASAAAPFAADA
jgi:signal transduction histidine kinase